MHIDPGSPIASGKSGVFNRLSKLDSINKIGFGNCLDLGAGNGAYSLELSKKINQVTAFDINKNYLANIKANLNPSLFIVNGSSDCLPFKSNLYESIFLIETIEHFPKLEKTIDEIYRVAKPGSIIYVTVPNKYFILETHHVYLFDNAIDGRFIPILSMFDFIHKKIGSARRFSVKSLAKVFGPKRFRLLGYEYMLPPFDNSNVGQKYLKPLSKTIDKGKLIFLFPTLLSVFKKI